MVVALQSTRQAAAEVEFFHMDIDEEFEGEAMMVNTAREGSEQEKWKSEEETDTMVPIIVDSGADASLFPGHLLGKGKQVAGTSPYLQDAQGSQIKTYVWTLCWSAEMEEG